MTGYEAVLYFALWTVVMLLMYVSHRIPLALAGKQPANYWTRGTHTDDPAIPFRNKAAELRVGSETVPEQLLLGHFNGIGFPFVNGELPNQPVYFFHVRLLSGSYAGFHICYK